MLGVSLCPEPVLGVSGHVSPSTPGEGTGGAVVPYLALQREVLPAPGTAELCRGCAELGVLNPSPACKWWVKIAQIPSSAGAC